MKVLFSISSSQIGGAEKQFLRVVTELKGEFEIAICVIGKPGPYLNLYKNLGVNQYVSTGSLFSDFRTILKAVKDFKPNSIVSFLYRSDVLIGLIGKHCGVKNILISARNTDWPEFNRLKKWIMKFVAKYKADTIISNSVRALDFHSKIGYPKSKFVCIRNFIDSDVEFRIRHKINTLGLAARTTKGKGHYTALQVHQKLLGIGMDLRLSMIGPSLNSWLRLKELINVDSSNIELVDGGTNITKWFDGIDLYLALSGNWESDSNSLLEAIVRGVPVICTQLQAIEDVSDHLTIVDLNDEEDIVARIIQLVQLPKNELERKLIKVRSELLKKRNSEQLRQEWINTLTR
jgi:glycosyltransferase involved in cell wall biosynthesis